MGGIFQQGTQEEESIRKPGIQENIKKAAIEEYISPNAAAI